MRPSKLHLDLTSDDREAEVGRLRDSAHRSYEPSGAR